MTHTNFNPHISIFRIHELSVTFLWSWAQCASPLTSECFETPSPPTTINPALNPSHFNFQDESYLSDVQEDDAVLAVNELRDVFWILLHSDPEICAEETEQQF